MAKKHTKKGAVVFYVDVGQLPPEKADTFVENMKVANKEFLDSLPEHVATVWLPVRNGNTRVEYLPLEH